MKTDLLDLRHMDCMEMMAEHEDDHFDLAIVDPPYGGGNHAKNNLRTGGGWSAKYGKKINKWDNAPPPEYFTELERVSKNRIIWGANYFTLPPSRCFLILEKPFIPENFTMAMCEYAWTSFDANAKIFKWHKKKEDYQFRTHPTQKPVALYNWLLQNYAEPGMKILDTHLGSGSHAIACHYFGAHLTASEIDADYYKDACARIDRETRQLTFL